MAACRNNAAIVLLKQKEWDKAEEACSQALFSLGPEGEPLARAKALYRRAVARLKQGEMETAELQSPLRGVFPVVGKYG